jgi:CRP/FNR family cyclic AMP-dependent transcriptional regulator
VLAKTKLWYLENFNLFDCLSHEKMLELSKMLRMQMISKNETIYFADDPSESIFLLKEGHVKLSRVSDEGREVITAILNPGEIFGELALTGSTARDDTATAMEDAVICAISRKNFEEMLVENPKFNLKITKFIGLKLQRVSRELETLVFKDSPARIAEFLFRYAMTSGKKIGSEIFIKSSLTHQDIASLTATSRQTVTSMLNNLKEKKIIDFTRNQIIIREPEALKKLT